MNILEKIVLHKKSELIQRKNQIPQSDLIGNWDSSKSASSLKKALLNPVGSKIIAEFKRESPSKGAIHTHAPLNEIVQGYLDAGAAALSVLTESKFFKGSDLDFIQARELSSIPMLRKDFMIDEYQFYEARNMGANAVLLIASILSNSEVRDFTQLAHSLEMEVLLEVHSLEELEKTYFEEIDLVGINNRDLTSFKVDIENSIRLSKSLPSHAIKIAESGISDPKLVIKLIESGFHGFLIGETFMKESNPGKALEGFRREIEELMR